MVHPKDIEIKNYTYELPENRIAKFPVDPKHNSKLLIYKNGIIKESVFHNITEELEPETLLVFNNTKVVEARLIFEKSSGGKIEVFCLQPANDVLWENALKSTNKVTMECLVGGISKWKSGPLVKNFIFNGQSIELKAFYKADLPDGKLIELVWDNEITFSDVLYAVGEMPIPPYLKRKAEEKDKEIYQTYYANKKGSVAAPTAGLHFTEKVFSDLNDKKIKTHFVTLHVGAGTFKPVKADKLGEHIMHSEAIVINKSSIETFLKNKTIIATGTTSMRLLETVYWLGVNIIKNPAAKLKNLKLDQWFAYENKTDISKEEALNALIHAMEKENIEEFYSSTQIIIVPGYQFKICDALITNFHQPNSTLLLLIAAAIGNDWQKVYDYALKHDFRFLSYGDSSLLWINKH